MKMKFIGLFFLSLITVGNLAAQADEPSYETEHTSVAAIEVPTLQIKNQVVCNGKPAEFHLPNTSFQNISWQPAHGIEQIGNTLIVRPEQTTTYTVTYQVGSEKYSTQFTAFVESVIANFAVTPRKGSVPMAVAITNSSQNDFNTVWQIDNETIESSQLDNYVFREPGNYDIKLTVKGQYGCISDKTISDIKVYSEAEFFIPNAFTPNYDGVNETFFVRPKNVLSFECRVFNGFGDLITVISDKNDHWDGHFNGYPAPSGAYVYKIEYTDLSGQIKDLIGSVELRR